MKTAKKVLAILLSIAMLLGMGATSAFAAEIGDEIKWTYLYDDGEEYIYYYELAGTLKEGENTVSEDYSEAAYEFEVAQDGYYFITSNNWFDVSETYQNGEAKNGADYCDMYYVTGEGEETEYHWGDVYYLTEGTVLIALETYITYDDDNTINIEYLGDINEINFDEEYLECLILGYDAYYYEEENLVEFYAEYSVAFSNGKTLEGDNEYALFETAGKPANGENVVTFDFLGYEAEVYANFYEITYFVDSIELQKYDRHFDAKYYYDGTIEYFDLGDEPEYVIVNYTNGSNGTFEFYYGPSYGNNTITLPNGKEIYVYAYLDYNEDGEICFVAGMADHYFIEEPCYIEAVSLSENFDYFAENMTSIIERGLDYITNRLVYMAEALSYGDFEYFMYQLQRLFESPYLGYFFEEISEFINYYI